MSGFNLNGQYPVLNFVLNNDLEETPVLRFYTFIYLWAS